MTTMSHPPKEELRAELRPLIEFSPVDKSNPKDCPLHLLRKAKRPQRLEWLNALDEDDLAYLAAYHHVCLHTKTASKPEEKSEAA